MQSSRANHYVPQFYLRGFAEPLSSQSSKKPVLWVYERSRAPRPSRPQHEAYENDFYAFEDVFGKRHSLERLIARIESRVAPILRRLEHLDYYPSNSERYHLAVFTSLMFVRGPRGRELISRSLGTAMKDHLQRIARDEVRFVADYERSRKRPGGPSPEEMRRYILEGNYEVLQKGAGFNLRTMVEAWDHLSPILFSMKWQILHADGGEPFITSDNPVFTLLPRGHGTAGFGTGFCWPMVEVYFPLTSGSCLRLTEAGVESTATIGGGGVRQINRGVAICASRFLYSRERSRKIAALFEKVGGRLSYGVNAFVHPSAAGKDPSLRSE